MRTRPRTGMRGKLSQAGSGEVDSGGELELFFQSLGIGEGFDEALEGAAQGVDLTLEGGLLIDLAGRRGWSGVGIICQG